MWPYCTQPLFHSAIPVIVNCTVLNGLSVAGGIVDRPVFVPSPQSPGAAFLDVAFTYAPTLWPWTGYLAVHLSVSEDGVDFTGIAEVRLPGACGKRGAGLPCGLIAAG